jgi:thioesterase DpgC
MNTITQEFIKKSDLAVKLQTLADWIATEETVLHTSDKATDSNAHRELQSKIAAFRGLIVQTHGEELYKLATEDFTKNLRLQELLDTLAQRVPSLLPTQTQFAEDSQVKLSKKKGYELSYGAILSAFLRVPKIAYHIMESMQLPMEESLSYKEQFFAEGKIEFRTVTLERQGNIGFMTLTNIDSLNAEDFLLMHEMELATDLILLDPKIDVGVIRGDVMDHKKYQGKRVFCSGVNLTKLYNGELPYMFYVAREFGLMNKIYRGLSSLDSIEEGIEKPWISVVDTHAIGGGCQIVLICDYVIAAEDAYFTIPARTEGFIPGLANLRLQRYTGHALARKMINMNHKVEANTTHGALLADEVQPTAQIEEALHNIVKEVSENGIHGMISNRKAFRIGVEPVETFRNYMEMFSKEQAQCMYNNEIIKNLEDFWGERLARRQRNTAKA